MVRLGWDFHLTVVGFKLIPRIPSVAPYMTLSTIPARFARTPWRTCATAIVNLFDNLILWSKMICLYIGNPSMAVLHTLDADCSQSIIQYCLSCIPFQPNWWTLQCILHPSSFTPLIFLARNVLLYQENVQCLPRLCTLQPRLQDIFQTCVSFSHRAALLSALRGCIQSFQSF